MKNCAFVRLLEQFQLNVESNPELLWFCFNSLFDWFINIAPLSQPIIIKTYTNLSFAVLIALILVL